MSTPEKSATPKALSDKDIQVLAHAWACFKTQPEIDYDALAKKCGMKDHTAAYKVLWAIKKKLATHGDGAPTTPKKAAKRGATDGDGKNSAKKRKTPVKSAQKGKLAEVGDENDDEIKDEMKEEEEEEDAAAV